MNPFTNPQEARAYVVTKILEQAATEHVNLTAFERKLLDGSVSEEQVDAFDEGEHADAFWDKVDLLVRHGLQTEKESGGRAAQRLYENALRLAETQPDYLAGIIKTERLSTSTLASKIERGFRRWLLLIPVCLFGGIGLAAALFGLSALKDHLDQSSGRKALGSYGVAAFLVLVAAVKVFTVLKLKARKSQDTDTAGI